MMHLGVPPPNFKLSDYIQYLEEYKLSKDHIERTKRMIEVMQAYVDGESWENIGMMAIKNFPKTLAELSKTPDIINWDHVSFGYQYLKRDENGVAYLYASNPDTCYIQIIKPEMANTFSSYRKGTVDWKESLVIRPGCE